MKYVPNYSATGKCEFCEEESDNRSSYFHWGWELFGKSAKYFTASSFHMICKDCHQILKDHKDECDREWEEDDNKRMGMAFGFSYVEEAGLATKNQLEELLPQIEEDNWKFNIDTFGGYIKRWKEEASEATTEV